MMSSCQEVYLYVSFIILSCFSYTNEAMAWHMTMTMTKTTPMTMTMTKTTSSSRRELLFEVVPKKITAAVAVATTSIMLPHASCNAAVAVSGGLTADAARGQFKQAVVSIDDLLLDWSTLTAVDGAPNLIRSTLGFLGNSSSALYNIEKAFKVLRDSEYVDDGIEFFETAEEFSVVWVRADSFADSANVKTGSGKQATPAENIENSRIQIVELQRLAKKLNAMLLQ